MTSAVRTHTPPLFLLPVVLLVLLFGVAVAMAQIAPGRVTTGIYQVIVWEGANEIVIPTESLSCARNGDMATCTAPAGSQRLTVRLAYTGVIEPGGCVAQHGDRPVGCTRQMGYYGHASNTVWIRGGLGLSEAQQAELRDQVPWWRNGLRTAGLALLAVLALATGAATFLLRRHSRPAPPRLRTPLMIGAALAGLGLFAATSLVIDPIRNDVILALSPLSVLAAAAFAAWQRELSGPPLGSRTTSAVIAGGAATMYSGIALLVFAMQAGFIG